MMNLRKLLAYALALAIISSVEVELRAQTAEGNFPLYWIPAGSSNWNLGANWSATDGGPPANALPDAALEEAGVINSGGTATLNVAALNQVGGVVIGQAGGDSGTLSLSTGGSLSITPTPSTLGNLVLGAGGDAGGTGHLTMSGGSLSANAITMGGNLTTRSGINLSGSSSVTLTGTAASTISRDMRVVGPSVNFQSAGSINFTNTGSYTREINSAAAHNALKSDANVAMAGNLTLHFNGATPTPGNTWNIFDSASVTGAFANVSGAGDVNVTGVAAPQLGEAYRLRQVSGGDNGRLTQVVYDNVLVLTVNRDSGVMSIRNPLGGAISIDGYTITSPTAGSLLTSYKGISGAPAGNAGWEKDPGNSINDLSELKPVGFFNLTSVPSVTLGTGFDKDAVFTNLGIGVSGEDLSFQYRRQGGGVVTGQIEYVGTQYLNNMALIVDSEGVATLKNDTLMNLSFDGYSITSSTGSLNASGWTSLQDRPESRFDGWQESPTSPTFLFETNPVAPMTINAGESLSLGDIGDFLTDAAKDGLGLDFILAGENFRVGTVLFQDSTGLAGDFDQDGDVDGRDFLVWQRGGSPNPLSAGDLAAWQGNYGATTPLVAVISVPEPSGLLLGLFAAIALIGVGCREPRQDMAM